MRKVVFRSVVCGAAAMMLAGFCFHPTDVKAGMQNYNFVSIDSGVVDSITVNGVTVEALYRPYDSSVDTDATYSCAAFVKRFYSQVYGQNVYGLNDIYSTPLVDSGSFAETSSPQVGDIIRDNYSVHWAIVKAVSGNTVTVIQQNAWDGSYTQAWVGATIEIGDPQYTFFHWDGSTAAQAPVSGYTINYDRPQIQETTAVLSAKVDNPARYPVAQVGCYLWDANDTLLTRHVEDCQRPESRFNMWYDVQGELGIALTPGTSYKYQFFVIQDGQEYAGAIQTFTTAGAAPAASQASAEGGPVSTEETDNIVVPDDEAVRSIGKIREIFGWEQAQALEALGTSYLVQIGVDQETQYFSVPTLMEKPASLILTFQNGRVAKAQWKYVYSSGSDTALAASQALYDQFCRVADPRMSVARNSVCKQPGNMTSTYGDKLEIVQDMEGDKPYVSVTVTSAFEEIFG